MLAENVPSSSVAVALIEYVAVPSAYVCETLDGLPLTTCVPSPQLIVHCVIVSVPGSVRDKLSVYGEPSFTSEAPLIASVGATL